MSIDELKVYLNDLSWSEQIDFELGETDPQPDDELMEEIQGKIKELGAALSSGHLDDLEKEDEYITWALRLSPYVPYDDPVKRARPYLNHHNGQVRFWASEISGENK